MERHPQTDIAIRRTVAVLEASTPAAATSKSPRDGAPHEPAALRSVVHLLTEARRALSNDNDGAHRYIARAAALLQAEADFRDQGIGSAPVSTRCRLAPWQVTRVLRFIDTHISEKIGPKTFANLTRLSTSHFARAFHATVGEAPYAYLIRQRVERAKEIMLETDFPLAQIALDCGLADQAHMTRLFSRIVGMSPAAWRRTHLAAAPRAVQEDALRCERPAAAQGQHARRFVPPTKHAA